MPVPWMWKRAINLEKRGEKSKEKRNEVNKRPSGCRPRQEMLRGGATRKAGEDVACKGGAVGGQL